MERSLSRQQLYDMIWECAVSKVAPELGISDVALRKQCVKHAIPLPDATYWGRLHAGRLVKPKPLGPAPAGISDTIIFTPKAPPPPEPIAMAIGQARETRGRIIVPDKLHPLVAKTLAAARKAQPDQHGAVTKLGSEVFHIRAHPDTLERVGTFLNALVYQAKSRGYKFAPGRDGLDAVVNDEAIAFSVYRTIRRTYHVETEEERRKVERWYARHRHDRSSWQGRPTIPYYDFLPTGEMVIELDRWTSYQGVQRRFTDTRVAEEAGTLKLLRDTLEHARAETSGKFVGPVARRARRYIEQLLPGCDLTFSEDLGLESVIRGGMSESCSNLSRGTQEQLAVLTRIAFADMLLDQGRPVSLILNDPLVYSDDARLDLMMEILIEAAGRMQVILLTCRERAFRHVGANRIRIS
jgi:hypothetical protein